MDGIEGDLRIFQLWGHISSLGGLFAASRVRYGGHRREASLLHRDRGTIGSFRCTLPFLVPFGCFARGGRHSRQGGARKVKKTGNES